MARRLTLLWSRKKNPVWRRGGGWRGRESRQDNPFTALHSKFVRETPAEAPRRLDKPFLTALELVE